MVRPLPPLLEALLSPHLHVPTINSSSTSGSTTSNTNNNHETTTKSNNTSPPRDPRQRPPAQPAPTPQIQNADVEDGEVDTPNNRPAAPVKRKEGRVPCKYWMDGKCSKGDLCTFNHQLTPNRTANQVRQEHERILSLPADDLLRMADAHPGRTLWEVLTQGVCRFRMGKSGTCTKGDSCLYSHQLHHIPCRFWHAWGRCAAGTACRFSHDRLDERLRERIKREAVEAVQRERAMGKRKHPDTDDAGDDNQQQQQHQFVDENADGNNNDNGNDDYAYSEELARQINPFA